MQNKMWLKRVLVPFWAIEMLWLLATLVIAGLGLYENETHMVGGKEVALHKIVRYVYTRQSDQLGADS